MTDNHGHALLHYGQEADQFIERYPLRSNDCPSLLLIHGGYWRQKFDREHMRAVADQLSELGWHVLLAEHRRVPGNPDATVQDIEAIFKLLEDEEIIVVGYSAGGQFALLQAPTLENIVGIVGLAPVTNLVATDELHLGDDAVTEWLQAPATSRPDLDPMNCEKIDVPVIFIHGTADVRVPIELSREFVQSRQQRGWDIELIEIEGAGHFELMDPAHLSWEVLVSALDEISAVEARKVG